MPAHRVEPAILQAESQPMMAISTFALGMFLFGLFFALVAACDHV
jgi:hypothetical protein